MDLFVIRSKKSLQEFTELIKERRLPLKVMLQTIDPKRTVNENDYLFGVVYKMIAEHTGQSVLEVHEGYKTLFNIEYSPDSKGYWALRLKSTTTFSTMSIMDYTEKVRADALVDLGINIPMPNEVFFNELIFIREM